MVGCWDGLWHCVCQCLPQYWSFLGGKLMVKRCPPVWKNIRMVVGKTVPFFDRQQGCAVQLLISWKKFRCHPRIDTYDFLGAKALRFGTMIGLYPNLLLLGSNGRAPIYKTYVHGLGLSHIFKFSELVHLPFLHDRHHLKTTMHYIIYMYIYIFPLLKSAPFRHENVATMPSFAPRRSMGMGLWPLYVDDEGGAGAKQHQPRSSEGMWRFHHGNQWFGFPLFYPLVN